MLTLNDLVHNAKEARYYLQDDVTILHTESGFLSTITDFFKDKLNNIRDLFNNSNTKYSIKTEPFIREMNTHAKNMSDLLTVPFSNVADIVIPTNETFKTDLLTTAQYINRGCISIANHIIPCLEETDVLISKVLLDPDYWNSSRPINTITDRSAVITELYELLDKLVDPNSKKELVEYKTLLNNVGTIEEIVKLNNQSADTGILTNTAKADSKSKSISDKINTIVKNINNSKYHNINKAALAKVAETIEDSGKIVTLCATYLYMLSQCAVITTNVLKVLDEASKAQIAKR